MINIKFILLIMLVLYASPGFSVPKDDDKNQQKPKSDRKILVEEFKDRNTGCEITYEYYKDSSGKKIMHGKYKRQWSLPKGHRSNWSGREMITATFVEGRLTGTVIINCEKYRWKKKNEFIKGKGRKVTLVAIESYQANNLKLTVKNDTLAGNFNFELGNLKYEAMGKVNEQGEMQGKYTLYRKNTTTQTDNAKNIAEDWVVEEQYLCDPDYTYRDAVPKVSEVNLGYTATTRGEQIRIKIPRLRLSLNPM
ncbi:MAG: hypothetical protein LBV43_09935 [Prevotella sp.]|jgi:hypothetical protein|nr:hypothetical protein [Prevotella sp.]